MPRTHTELIDELSKRVDLIALALEALRASNNAELNYIRSSLKDFQDQLKEFRQFDQRTGERLATLEERCKALEKGTDRVWQFAPLVISAVAVLVSLVVAFVKK